MFEAAVFDLDGTLTDTEPFHRQAWQRVLNKYGHMITDEDYSKRIAGRPTLMLVTKEFDFPVEQAESLYEEIQAAFWDISGGRFSPLPGLLTFLQYLGDMPRAIATGERAPAANRRLNALPLPGKFQAVVSGDDITKGKPDPEIFLTAASRLGVSPTNCIAFEDSLNGLAAARAAGMYCVALTTSHTVEELSIAHLVIDDYHDPRLLSLQIQSK